MNENIRAALMIVVGMAMISTNDVILKLSRADYGVGQILLVRGVMAVALFALLIRIRKKRLFVPWMFRGPSLGRAVCECLATFCFVFSLGILPIATVTTLAWAAPIFLTLASVMFLGERVAIVRWTAVVAGFVGVLMVTNPWAEEFRWEMLLPLVTAIFIAARDLLTKSIHESVDSASVVLVTLIVVSIGGGVLAVFDWQPISIWHTAQLLISAALLSFGFYLNIRGVRTGELSFVAPFFFFSIPVSIFWGYVVWGDTLSAIAVAGILLIIASGLVILLRQGRRTTEPPD